MALPRGNSVVSGVNRTLDIGGAKFQVSLDVFENGRKAPQYTLDTDLQGEITLSELFEFTKFALISTARDVLTQEQEKGFDKDPVVIVDGSYNKAVIDVKPLGKIEFAARQEMKDIILDTYAAILERSPVDTGRYIKSHLVYLNGNLIATDWASLGSWLFTEPEFKERDYIRFVNVQPYARKLERLGVTSKGQRHRAQKSRDSRGRSGTHVLAPNGAYFLASRAIRRKYKRNSVIAFKFISGSEGYLNVPGQFKTKSGGARQPHKGLNFHGQRSQKTSSGRKYLYPSITISVDVSGLVGGGD